MDRELRGDLAGEDSYSAAEMGERLEDRAASLSAAGFSPSTGPGRQRLTVAGVAIRRSMEPSAGRRPPAAVPARRPCPFRKTAWFKRRRVFGQRFGVVGPTTPARSASEDWP